MNLLDSVKLLKRCFIIHDKVVTFKYSSTGATYFLTTFFYFIFFLLWTIFKVLIEFVTILLLFCVFWVFGHEAP